VFLQVAIKLVALERSKVEEMRKRLALVESGASVDNDASALREKLSSREKAHEIEMNSLKKRLEDLEKAKESEVNALKRRVAELESSAGRGLNDSKSVIASVLTTEEKLRRAVVAEMIKTEKDYLDDLIVLRGVVFENLRSLDPSLTADELAKLIAASSKLLDGLQRDASVGDAIPSLMNDLINDSLTAYSEYCSGSFSTATAMMLKNSKAFAGLRKKLEADPSLKVGRFCHFFFLSLKTFCRVFLLRRS
jgi:hypothetical protein